MNTDEMFKFREMLSSIEKMPATAWVYLPSDKNWSLDSDCAVLESEEVPPELEDDPDAGVPEFAKRNNLIQALPVTVVQDIATNARSQKPDANLGDLLYAFLYYYKHDAFVELT